MPFVVMGAVFAPRVSSNGCPGPLPVAAAIEPAVLQGGQQRRVHGLGDVGVDASDSGQLVAESLASEWLGDAVFVHPGVVGVSEVVKPDAG